MSPNDDKRDSVGLDINQEDTNLIHQHAQLLQPPADCHLLTSDVHENSKYAVEIINGDIYPRGIEEDILGPVEDTLCGLGKIRSRYLQKLARPVTYLVISSVVALVQGMFFTYSNATLSTVEKRFRLPSKVSGFTTTGNDLVQLFLSVHITYLAGQGHRPRWLAMGMIGASIGCVLAATPHFIFGEGDSTLSPSTHTEHQQANAAQFITNGNISDSSGLFCQSVNSSIDDCYKDTAHVGTEQYTVVILLLIAQMLAGFASMLYYTVGYSYLDEAVCKDRVPLFLAVSGSLRILGPVCGYSMAAWSLSYWVNPLQPPSLSPTHPGWIGAWWIGYLVIGTTLLIITWSLLLLPKTLPGARKRALLSLKLAAKKGKEHLQKFSETLRPAKARGYGAMCPSMQRILTNKVYVLIIINQIFFWFAFFGYITFKPKYLEHQFKISAAKANQYIAGAAMAATLVGWLGTGGALTIFQPRAKYVISFMAFLSATNCILHLCMVNISCDHDLIHGMDKALRAIKSPSDHQTSHKNLFFSQELTSECLSSCTCSLKFSPVCVDGIHNYYNPCFAGCASASKQNKSTVYENCACSKNVINTLKLSNTMSVELLRETEDKSTYYHDKEINPGPESMVLDGYCSYDCSSFYMYLILTVLTKMTHAASRVPVNLILFRCVEERDKDVGLGIFNAALALFSSIPAPIVFGWAIDYSCKLWENSCNKQGFCWLYDINMYRYILHGIPAALMAGCLVTELVLLSLHKSIHFYGKEVSESSGSQDLAKRQGEQPDEMTELNTNTC
ncbi:hypothetical protein SK128_013125 [Halocaridina rubra]|uniref:Solute carrier organic anion transporter family member n=1 Tax=Halocaridina rubra TaxID=373956 RepID=A0AAN8X766_HALRR